MYFLCLSHITIVRVWLIVFQCYSLELALSEWNHCIRVLQIFKISGAKPGEYCGESFRDDLKESMQRKVQQLPISMHM